MVAVGFAACEDKGPMQKAGEKMDRATDQDKVIGTGPDQPHPGPADRIAAGRKLP
jgi:hypothetical protein